MNAEVTTDKLYDDLRAVVRDAEALLKAANGAAGDKVEELRTRAEETFRQAQARLENAENEALRRARELTQAADNYVREYPWQAVGIAAGVGLVLGLLLSKRT